MASQVNRPIACVGALVESPEGQILIAKTTKWRGLWGVPGGKIEYGETTIQAVVREFKEEVDLDIFDVEFCQLQDSIESPEFHKPIHFLLIDFFAKTRKTEVSPNEEILEWAWVQPHDALSYPLNTVTKTLVEKFISRSSQ